MRGPLTNVAPNGMEETKRTRPRFFGVQFKLLILLVVVALFFGAVTVTSLFGLYRVGQSSDIIVRQEVPIVRSIQEALSAMAIGLSTAESALDIDNPKDANEIDRQGEEFKKSIARFSMFMAAITWGSETEAFQRSSGGENYQAWTDAGLKGVLVVRESTPEQIELAGQTGIYYEGFVNNAQKAIALRKEFLNLSAKEKLNDAEKAKALSRENVLKARRFADLTIGNLSQMVELSNVATLESANALKTTEEEVRNTTIFISLLGFLVLASLFYSTSGMEETKRTRPRFFGVQFKLLNLLVVVALFFGAVTVTSLLGLYRVGQSSDIIVGREVPIVRSIQEALSAMAIGLSTAESALDIDNPKDANEIDRQGEEFKKSIVRFSMFMAAITWGSETEAFQRSSGGENYQAWTNAGLKGVLVVRESTPEQIELAGQTGIYYEGFVNNAQKAIALRKEFLNLSAKEKLNDAEKAKALSRENVLKARRFADLTIGNLSQMVELSNVATLESANALKTTEVEVRNTTIFISLLGFLTSIILCVIFARIVIIRPITNLRTAANTLSKGDNTARAWVMSGDEMGQLAISFNKMATSLASYSEDLEKKVVERTKEVEKKATEIVQAKVHIETIIENLTSGLVEYNNDFTILRVNHTAEEMLGIQRGNVVGVQIRPEDTRKIELESIARVSYPGITPGVLKLPKGISGVSNAEVHEITVRYPVERELQVVTAPVINPATGDAYGFVKVLRDITREKMIAKSKSAFISIAAHQLRTPLSGVKWTMKLVMDGDMGPLNPEQLLYLTRGYETAQKMVLLVNDLLNVARIEEGRFGYEFEEADIVGTLLTTLNNAKLSAKTRDIEVEFLDNTGGVKPFLFDAGKISLAVQNLLDNAIKYTNPSGKVFLAIEKEGDYLKVKISDNGVGIPKTQIDRLFSKFFRADNVMHMQTDGSGLGLFIVKNIILRHGGNITVESEEGKGTTFIFTIPFKEELLPKEEKLEYY